MTGETARGLWVWRPAGLGLRGGVGPKPKTGLGVPDQPCPYCGTYPVLKRIYSNTRDLLRPVWGFTEIDYYFDCPLCGWLYRLESHLGTTLTDLETNYVLQHFSLDSESVALHELGTALRHDRAGVYQISPRRFEMLVEDIFARLGFKTLLTPSTRDGGADILILHNTSQRLIAIVECKHFRNHRVVGAGIVRCLVGAAIAFDVRKAYLVTSSDFTPPARHTAESMRVHGYEIDLVALADLAQLLGVYNTALPRVDKLRQRDIRSIIQENTRRLQPNTGLQPAAGARGRGLFHWLRRRARRD